LNDFSRMEVVTDSALAKSIHCYNSSPNFGGFAPFLVLHSSHC
jgi:hypothetical protein